MVRWSKAATDDGGRLRHLFHRLQPVEPGHQRVVQRRRDRQRAQRPIKAIGVALSRSTPDSMTALVISSTNSGTPSVLAAISSSRASGKRLPRVMRSDDRLRRGARQPVQRQPRDDRMAGEGGNEGRARGDQHQDARRPARDRAPARSAPTSWDRSSARPRSPTAPACRWPSPTSWSIRTPSVRLRRCCGVSVSAP